MEWDVNVDPVFGTVVCGGYSAPGLLRQAGILVHERLRYLLVVNRLVAH
jgi:nitrogenase subunit NifH